MLPSLRKKLKGVSSRNQSLQDILRTLTDATEIVSIKSHSGGIHNTSIVLKVDLGEQFSENVRYETRVHFYNRIPLEDILIGLDYTGNSIAAIIQKLNLQGCDFNEDDLELINGNLRAKDISLGYYNKTDLPVDVCYCVMDHQGLSITDNSYLSDSVWINDGQTQILVSGYKLEVTVNGIVYNSDVPIGWGISAAIAAIFDLNDLYDKMSFSLTSAGSPSLFVQNLTNECGMFGFKLQGVPVDTLLSPVLLVLAPLIELCPLGERKLVCPNAPYRVNLRDIFGYMAYYPGGIYTLEINGVKSSFEPAVGQGTPWNVSAVTILDELSQTTGLNWFYSLSGTSGAYAWCLDNQTGDCLDFKLYYQETINANKHYMLDFLLGPTNDANGNWIGTEMEGEINFPPNTNFPK